MAKMKRRAPKAKKKTVRRATKAAGAKKAKVARARATARPAATRRPAAHARAAAAPRSDALRALAKRIVDLTISGNDDASFALYADNVESVEMGQAPMTGIDAIRQKFTQWRGMVSDSAWDAKSVWVDGNTIVIEWIGRVTLAASGKSVDMREIAVHEVENGKIARERFYYNPAIFQG